MGRRHRPRPQDRPPRLRRRDPLRPPGSLARHRHPIRHRPRLLLRGRRQNAPRLEVWHPGPAPQVTDPRHARRRHLLDGRPAQPVSLPPGPLRAHFDDRSHLQATEPDGKNPHSRTEREILEAGPSSRKAGNATTPA
jgi:hypothetical protein